MKRCLVYLKDMKFLIALALFLKFITSITELAIPWILDFMLDELAPTGDVQLIAYMGIGMVICALFTALGNLWANRITAKISRNSIEGLRNDVFTKVYSLSIDQLDELTISSAVSRLTTDVQNIHQVIGSTIRMGIRAPLIVIGGMIFTAMMDPKLSQILFILFPIIAVATYFTTKRGTFLHTSIQRANDDLVNITRDSVSGVMEIKGYATEEKEKMRFEEISEALRKQEMRTAKLMSFFNPAVNLLLNIGLVAVVLFGGYFAQDGSSTPSNIIAFLSYFTMISASLMAINRLFITIARGNASAARIEQLLYIKTKEPEPKNNDKDEEENFITFDDVTFKYGSGYNVVENISFSLKKGETLGILGPTGSGKTTLVNLLQGFYKPTSGKIFIDSEDISTIKEQDIHKKFGVVMQNDCVFSDTVKGNIRIGRTLDDQNMWKALDIADLKKFVSSKETGLEYDINSSGTNLSGGQRQRLLIARAISKKPEILILDDSSSALDYSTDAKIRRAISKEMHCTTVIIAQRITSLMDSHKILLLSDKGTAVALGTHKELIHNCKEYQDLWNFQTGGAKYE
ncbi:MAG: ABC transporter ATP-binding protein [Clostridia bacterium]